MSHQRRLSLLLAAAVMAWTGGAHHAAAADPPKSRSHVHVQPAYESPEAAASALLAAMKGGDAMAVHQVLGPGSGRLIRSGDPVADRLGRERFIAAYEKLSRIEREGEAKATLLIGEKEWPFPFPIVMADGKWRFDARSGAEEILNRRIGRNELSAIQVCLAYVDAQREYALTAGNVGGLKEYAARFVSSPGRRDGLYWPTKEGDPQSPLGPIASKAKEEGYASQPYHGYHYRILTSQGPDAPGGAYDYVVKGRMIGGFAMVAWPARWGASGVMTFVVNHDGVVYQKNLGRETGQVVSRMTSFDPDASWTKAQP